MAHPNTRYSPSCLTVTVAATSTKALPVSHNLTAGDFGTNPESSESSFVYSSSNEPVFSESLDMSVEPKNLTVTNSTAPRPVQTTLNEIEDPSVHTIPENDCCEKIESK